MSVDGGVCVAYTDNMTNANNATISDIRRLRGDAYAMIRRLRTEAERDDLSMGVRLDLTWRESRIRDEVQAELDGQSTLALVQRRIDEARRVLAAVQS